MNRDDTPALDRFAAEWIGRKRHESVRQWLEELDSRLGVRPHAIFPTEALLGHMPMVIAEIADALAAPETASRTELVDRVRTLARLRREQGYDVQEVLEEFALLGQLLYRMLTEAVAAYPDPAEPAAVAELGARLHAELSAMDTITAGTYREQAGHEQRERNERLENFGRTLAHELKNPLGAAEGGAQMLQEEEIISDPDARQRFAKLILRNLRRTRELIDDVHALAVAQGGEGPERRRAPLPSIVEAVFDEVEDVAEEKQVRLEACEPLPDVDVDKTRVQLALINLVANAIKYSDPEKPERWVKLDAERAEADGWAVSVQDNGLGIPESQHGRMFERFFRAHPETAEGTGLGLAITRQAIEQQGGRIGFESRKGAGSTFRFTIPDPAEVERGSEEEAA